MKDGRIMLELHTLFARSKNMKLKNFRLWFFGSPARRESKELEFGYNWRFEEFTERGHWKVAWIEVTGELYAVDMSLSKVDAEREFFLIAVIESEELVGELMEGYENSTLSIPDWFCRERLEKLEHCKEILDKMFFVW